MGWLKTKLVNPFVWFSKKVFSRWTYKTVVTERFLSLSDDIDLIKAELDFSKFNYRSERLKVMEAKLKEIEALLFLLANASGFGYCVEDPLVSWVKLRKPRKKRRRRKAK